jgi:hypothetical protein
MGCETVAQRVRSDPLGDLRGLCRLDDDAMELPGADRLHGVLSRKQPTVAMHHALLAPDFPPLAQQGEQIRREHGIAIPATLATLDPEQHALAVNVGHLERRDLGHAQARALGDREGRLVLEAGGRVEQSCDLVPAQHHGQVARMHCPDQLACQVRSVDRVNRNAETMLFMVGVGTPRSRCSIWNRRMSSAVAVSGERRRKVAKRPTSRM